MRIGRKSAKWGESGWAIRRVMPYTTTSVSASLFQPYSWNAYFSATSWRQSRLSMYWRMNSSESAVAGSPSGYVATPEKRRVLAEANGSMVRGTTGTLISSRSTTSLRCPRYASDKMMTGLWLSSAALKAWIVYSWHSATVDG